MTAEKYIEIMEHLVKLRREAEENVIGCNAKYSVGDLVRTKLRDRNESMTVLKVMAKIAGSKVHFWYVLLDSKESKCQVREEGLEAVRFCPHCRHNL